MHITSFTIICKTVFLKDLNRLDFFMQHRRILRQFMPVFFAALVFFTSCNDETGTLGLDVLPQDDLFSGTDTSSHFPAQNINPDRLRSDDAKYAILGTVDDPYAGPTDASFITEVTLGSLSGELDKSDKYKKYYADSLVLNLEVESGGWFGESLAKHDVQVYQLNQSLSLTDKYYANMSVEGLYDETPIGEKICSPLDTVPFISGKDTSYIHQWQIKLEDQLALKMFSYKKDTMSDREIFRDVFKPLFIKSELASNDTKGSLVPLNLLSTKSNLTLYYSYDELDTVTNNVDTTKHASYTFPINIECLRINRFDHNNQGTIDFNDPDANHLVVQGMAGSMVKIDFNDIKCLDEDNKSVNLFDFWESKISLPDKNEKYYGISAVDVFFKVDTLLHPEDDSFMSPIPQLLTLYRMTDDGELEIPSYSYKSDDDSEWSPEFYGGAFNKSAGEYQFRLTNESFLMMVKKPELRGPYYLSFTDPASYTFSIFPWRVVLKNNNNVDIEDQSPQFRIKYVTIQNPE